MSAGAVPTDDLPVDMNAGPVEHVDTPQPVETPQEEAAIPYQPLRGDGEAPSLTALPRRAVVPIPNEYLARGVAFAASFGLPQQMAAQQHIYSTIYPGINDGELGEALAEMGIGLPAGVDEAPAWLRATLVLGAAGLAAAQARRAWHPDDDSDSAVAAETRDPERESAEHEGQDAFSSPAV